MQHILQFLGHPAPLPTNSFARALPPEQEGSAASLLTAKRAMGPTAQSKCNSTLNIAQEKVPGVELKIQVNTDTMQQATTSGLGI